MTENEKDRIKVIVCRTGEKAEAIEIEDSLKAMQDLVGGMIQEYMPWEDEVAIICNEEGKINGMPLNRGIRDEEGHLLDIMAGDFFICYAPIESERFLSMPPELEQKYIDMFELPEMFLADGDRLETLSYEPEEKKKQNNSAPARKIDDRDYAR